MFVSRFVNEQSEELIDYPQREEGFKFPVLCMKARTVTCEISGKGPF